ncbi:MAG: asparagine synthase (glutamine-hydrolyzing) [Bacteroidetes bacterium]|nr:asparagine synthase (glutamine-hydrolyzing) [Bacteroidota bacterium]
MCGIAGVVAFTGQAREYQSDIEQAVSTLSQRGPDSNGIFIHNHIAFGSSRLSIIDTSEKANQPLHDANARYVIVYNGEIYNYKELRKELLQKGVEFKTESDTEVLLNMYIHFKDDFLNRLNGFYSFAIYDKETGSVFIARDKIGIKPLLYYQDDDKLIFASEMKALLAFPIRRKIDSTSLYQYLQLNYIPAPATILEGVQKLEPGNYLEYSNNEIKKVSYYNIEISSNPDIKSNHYNDQKTQLRKLIDNSVEKRMISDVPLGSFLSGGLDSSIIVATAAQFTKKLSTFTISYPDDPMYDESKYAAMVAKKFNTDHTVFEVNNDSLFEHLDNVLNYLDEPFADSSALPVYILSNLTRQNITVALSGDGGDELFAGYNKHHAEWLSLIKDSRGKMLSWFSLLWKVLPQSRNSFISNKVRQYNRFSTGAKLSSADRYWYWATFTDEKMAAEMMVTGFDEKEYDNRKQHILRYLNNETNSLDNGSEDQKMNEVLRTDATLVLPNDMLHKVDMMSMANSLEVRVPLLDHNIVDYIFSLQADAKIDKHRQKKLLRDAYEEILPPEILTRPKHGFEVPLLSWFTTGLRDRIEKEWLNEAFIQEQGIFDPAMMRKVKNRLYSSRPGDIQNVVWRLIVFQNWYKKYMPN